MVDLVGGWSNKKAKNCLESVKRHVPAFPHRCCCSAVHVPPARHNDHHATNLSLGLIVHKLNLKPNSTFMRCRGCLQLLLATFRCWHYNTVYHKNETSSIQILWTYYRNSSISDGLKLNVDFSCDGLSSLPFLPAARFRVCRLQARHKN